MWESSGYKGLELLRADRYSAEDWARDCLQRIAERDNLVKAWAYVEPSHVLDQARERDKSNALNVLHGVPIGVKDIVLTQDMPTQYNSPLYQGHFPKVDANCVSILRSNGAVIVGKTETVEFASNGRKPLTRNPADLARTPGGSSSGSAAAVADGHVPIAVGTQTAGSIIRPASFCGVYGYKPSWGLVSLDGVMSYSPSLDTLGWYSRSAADLALMFEAFDLDHCREQPSSAEKSCSELKIGICQTPFWDHAKQELVTMMDSLDQRYLASGASVERLVLPESFANLIHAWKAINFAEGRASFKAKLLTAPDQLHDFIKSHFHRDNRVSAQELLQCYDLAASCRQQFDELAADFDFIIAPSSTGYAPLGLNDTGNSIFNAMWTLLHVPCLNIPYKPSDLDLPMGYTILSSRFTDKALLNYAQLIEREGL